MSPAISDLCVIGHPSRVGGADTELDHQIRCWQAMGVSSAFARGWRNPTVTAKSVRTAKT